MARKKQLSVVTVYFYDETGLPPRTLKTSKAPLSRVMRRAHRMVHKNHDIRFVDVISTALEAPVRIWPNWRGTEIEMKLGDTVTVVV